VQVFTRDGTFINLFCFPSFLDPPSIRILIYDFRRTLHDYIGIRPQDQTPYAIDHRHLISSSQRLRLNNHNNNLDFNLAPGQKTKMVCTGLAERIKKDARKNALDNANRNIFSNMLPPLLYPNHPANLAAVQARHRHDPVHRYDPACHQRARMQGRKEGYALAMDRMGMCSEPT
jgi:hypothetical protein